MTERRVPAPETEPADHGMSDLRTLAGGSTVTLVGMIAKGALGFVLVLVVTRGLGPQGSGLFFQATALFLILAAVKMGADTGLVRFVSRSIALGRPQDVRSVLRIATIPVAVVTTALGAAVFLFAPWLAHAVFEGVEPARATSSLRVLSAFLPLAAVSDVLVGGTRGFGTVLPYVAVESVGKPLLRPVFVWIALAAGATGLGVLTAWSLPIVLGLPLVAWWLLTLLRRLDGQPGGPSPSASGTSLTREFWTFCIPQGFAALLQTCVRSLDVLLVGALRTTAEAGVYAAVSRTVLFGQFAIESVRIAIAPQISALLASEDHARAEAVYRVATWWLVLVSWPVYLFLAVFAPSITSVFGAGFAGGQDALTLLSLGMLLSIGTGNVSTLLLMSGRSSAVLFNTSAALAVDVGLNVVLIPRMGIEGAAVAWVVSIATGELLALWQSWRHLRILPFGSGFAVAAFGSLGCYGAIELAVRWRFGTSLPVMATALVLSTAAYGALLYRFRSMLQLGALWHVVTHPFGSSGLPTPTA